MAVSSLSLNFVSKPFTYNLGVRGWISPAECAAVSITKCSKMVSFDEETNQEIYNDGGIMASFTSLSAQLAVTRNCKRRALILGMGALTLNPLRSSPLLAEEIPAKYDIFVDKVDGYSYYYPSDWRDFDFLGHDSAFKDRSLQLQNVRLSFIPTNKTDIRDLGPMDEVVFHLVNDVYSAPNQIADILDMQEKNIDGRNYWTFEYVLTSPNFSRAAFATIAIGNGRYYTLIVGANQRRWRRYRNMLKVVADSFKVMEI